MEDVSFFFFLITPLTPHLLLSQSWLKMNGIVPYCPQPDIKGPTLLLSSLQDSLLSRQHCTGRRAFASTALLYLL